MSLSRRGFLQVAAAAFTVPAVPWDSLAPVAWDVIAFSPHPDDETLSMGAYLASRAGARVLVVPVTAGGASAVLRELPLDRAAFEAARLSEQQAACFALGAVQGTCAGLPDGAVTVAAARAVMGPYVAAHPAAVFVTTSPIDAHPDHRACANALGQLTSAPVWCVTRLAGVSAPSTVTDVTGRVAAACRAYLADAAPAAWAIGRRSLGARAWAHHMTHPTTAVYRV